MAETTLAELTNTTGMMRAIALVGSWSNRHRPVWVHVALPSAVKVLRRCSSALEMLLTRAKEAGCSVSLEWSASSQMWQLEVASSLRIEAKQCSAETQQCPDQCG